MSLRVNLITPTEKRSGSRVNARTFIHIGQFVIPAIILFAIGKLTLGIMMTSSQMHTMEARWKIAEPREARAKKLAAILNYNRGTEAELEKWKESSIRLNKQLQAVADCTPDTIQLISVILSRDEVTVSENKKNSKKNKRRKHDIKKIRFALTIDGKTGDEHAMDQIEIFKEKLTHHNSVTNIIESVEVTNYEADTSDNAGELDRIFQIECVYKLLPEDKKR